MPRSIHFTPPKEGKTSNQLPERSGNTQRKGETVSTQKTAPNKIGLVSGKTARIKDAKPLSASRLKAEQWALQLFSLLEKIHLMNRLEQKACRLLVYRMAAEASNSSLTAKSDLPTQLQGPDLQTGDVAQCIGDFISQELGMPSMTAAHFAETFGK